MDARKTDYMDAIVADVDIKNNIAYTRTYLYIHRGRREISYENYRLSAESN